MSIKYRTVDAEATENNVLKQRAVEADLRAYQQEVEALRLESLEPIATTKEDKQALRDAAKAARENAAPDRNRAKRLNQDSVATTEDFAGSRKEFLNNWITSLEGEHVSHTALLKQREASLATDGEFAPSEEDRERIEKNIQDNKSALEVIESAWNVATKELDSLL